MTQEDRFREERKRNRVAYAIEDFYDSIDDLTKMWLGHIILGGFLALSLIFGADNRFHLLCTLLSAVGIYAVQQYLDLARIPVLIVSILLFLGSVAAEFGLGGIPDTLIHALSLEQGWRGIFPTLNALTPGLYIAARIGMVYLLVNVYLQRLRLGKQNAGILRQLDQELSGRIQ
jgi:hypothetical protein